MRSLSLAVYLLLASGCVHEPRTPEQAAALQIGLARVDITPTESVRLSGYQSRGEPATEVAGRLTATALAFGPAESATLLVAFDGIGMSQDMSDELAKRLGVERGHLALCATHTHAAPQLDGVLPFMFHTELPAEQTEAIGRYTDDLLDNLEKVSRAAIADIRPGLMAVGAGEVAIAANRRVIRDGRWTGFGVQADGPVDHSLPFMRITEPDGSLRAVLANYACHCTTLGGNFNAVHGDWAGAARDEFEARHPGALAMITIGCGGDQNPEPRGTLDSTLAHGAAIAEELERLVTDNLVSLTELPQPTFEEISLPFQKLQSAEDWRQLVAENPGRAYFANAMLERLERGETLPNHVVYPVQTWRFDDAFNMVFLGGEVVVDYALRLKRELGESLWITAYANDVPCYIPSKRIHPEGGYEVDRSMDYYGQPGSLSPDAEDLIVSEVKRQLTPGPRQTNR